jgi:nicotinate-nucleotide pyrophosphorylase (carboxylating)
MQRADLERFVAEDVGEWDDSSTIAKDEEGSAHIIAKEKCVIAGLQEAAQVLQHFHLEHEMLLADGDHATAGCIVLTIKGSARGILQAERLVLNFLGRMSGIATLTNECVRRARAVSGVKIACTRKTTPGFRLQEKRAVFLGGGDPHRFNLSDAVLIKDNHIRLLGLEECLLRAIGQASFTKKIEVEVEHLDDMARAAELGADIIMFDNMSPEEIGRGVEILKEIGLRDRVILEASGGITLENLEAYAAAGVDVISMGALTRDAPWIDLSMEMEKG